MYDERVKVRASDKSVVFHKLTKMSNYEFVLN